MRTERLLEEASRWGVQPAYQDTSGRWRDSPIEAVEAVLLELKARSEGPPEVLPGSMDHDCAPPSGRTWGLSIQLPSLVSKDSQGMGDLVDLKLFGRRARQELGAGFVLINPLSAGLPHASQEASPYFRSSRIFRDPLYLRLPEGSFEVTDPIDRDVLYAWKISRLRSRFELFGGDQGFDAFVEDRGVELQRFATFQSLSQRFQTPWRAWPDDFRGPSGQQVERWARSNAEEIKFHCWIQWQIDEQLQEAATEIDLVGDLPVGADPSGAEAWAWQAVLATGFTVGAPPDDFNSNGQDWGVAPFHPSSLALDDYRVFRQLVAANMRHVSGLRIDHVMGLFRLFWIPSGGAPRDGVYVRYPYPELVGIVAGESRRTGVFVVGEDLGTVEPLVRQVMGQAGMLGYKVFWFEDTIDSMNGLNLVSVTTHDLPTIPGVIAGFDEHEQIALGMDPGDRMGELKGKILRLAESSQRDPVISVYATLSRSDAPLLAVAIEDVLGVEQRPNMPGTLSERPNWSRVLPYKIEEIFEHPMVVEVAAVLRDRAMPR